MMLWRHRWLRLPAVVVVAWMSGFVWFVHAAWSPPVAPPRSDGIVVLTGGAERVTVGLRLLAAGAAERMLISGVGRAAEFPELAHRAGVDRALAPRVVLGRAASDTRGNAAETSDWVAEHSIGSLIVVTAGYHMPRALAELRQRLPNVTLIPVTVQPPGARDLRDPTSWRLLAGEYTKFLVAELGLAEFAGRAGLAARTGFVGLDPSAEHGG
jgi:uncharacterized SAM-binding protein YcdF (DUF218 family)